MREAYRLMQSVVWGERGDKKEDDSRGAPSSPRTNPRRRRGPESILVYPATLHNLESHLPWAGLPGHSLTTPLQTCQQEKGLGSPGDRRSQEGEGDKAQCSLWHFPRCQSHSLINLRHSLRGGESSFPFYG